MDHQPSFASQDVSEEAEETQATETPVDTVPEPVPIIDEPPVEQVPPPAMRDSSVAVGLIIAVAFILGLALGFFGRPALIQDLPIEVVVTVVPNQNEAITQAAPPDTSADAVVAEETTDEENAEQPAPEAEAGDGMPTPTIMDFVLSDARHIQGEEAAPVTIIEFSDFN